MNKKLLMLTMLVTAGIACETHCKKEKNPKKVTAKKETPKKAQSKKMSTEEYNFWDEKAQVLARTYETNNQEEFPNTGGQRNQQLEEIRALEGAIKELKAGEKSEFWSDEADNLAASYTEYHPEVKDAKKSHKKVINALEKILKDWKSEFQMANEDPEAAYLG